MEDAKVVPDVIDKAPSKLIKVAYPSGCAVDLGKELTPTQVKDLPAVSWEAEPGALYTLCMTDPDPPDPKMREILHWLVVNIPGSDVNKGETITQYVGSGPPQGSGLHRYIFLAYRQQGRISFDEELRLKYSTREGRRAFSVRALASNKHLGDPVAGNFYLAQYDDYVPILHARFAQMK